MSNKNILEEKLNEAFLEDDEDILMTSDMIEKAVDDLRAEGYKVSYCSANDTGEWSRIGAYDQEFKGFSLINFQGENFYAEIFRERKINGSGDHDYKAPELFNLMTEEEFNEKR